jgi:hypothetical protein
VVKVEKLEQPQDWRSEADFQKHLLALFRARGWRCSHNPPRPGRPGQRRLLTFADPGFPDVTALRPPDLVFLELKFYGKTADPEQRVWLNGLAGIEGNLRAWCVDPGAWPLLVRLAREGIAAIEKHSEPEEAAKELA